MIKKKIVIAIATVIALVLCVILFMQMISAEYVPADDEIALHIQLDTNEDIGLLIFDYRADDYESSGGISNANKSLMKHNDILINTWNKQELNCDSDTVELSMQMRIITEYVNPNFENIYSDDITKYTNSISWKAQFGKSYFITITGDKINGYKAVLEQ